MWLRTQRAHVATSSRADRAAGNGEARLTSCVRGERRRYVASSRLEVTCGAAAVSKNDGRTRVGRVRPFVVGGNLRQALCYFAGLSITAISTWWATWR